MRGMKTDSPAPQPVKMSASMTHLCRLCTRRRVPLHNLGTCKLRRSIMGAPTFNVISWPGSTGAVTKSRNSSVYYTASSWLRTVLTDLYVHFLALEGRQDLVDPCCLFVRGREVGTTTDPGALQAEQFTNPGVKRDILRLPVFSNVPSPTI